MKRVVIILLMFALITNPISFSTYAETEYYNYLSEDEFLTMVEENEFYFEYNDYFISNEYDVSTEILDIDSNPIGRMARVELEYGNSGSEYVSFASFLVFSYEYSTGVLNVNLVDNNELYSNKKIIVNDLIQGTSVVVDVSNEEFIEEFLNEVEAEIELEEINYENTLESMGDDNAEIAAGYWCFGCTQYETQPNTWDNNCISKFGWACGAVGISTGLPGYLLCSGITVLACWVPAYKICVAGKWSSNCPIQA